MAAEKRARDRFVARIDARRRFARRWTWLRGRFVPPQQSRQAEIYDATFRSDLEVVSYLYAARNDHLPDFDHPTRLNEKIRWQFLNHPNPLMTLAADKIAVRDYLAFKGARIAGPAIHLTLSDPAVLATAEMPGRFVLKSSFGSGQVHIQDGGARMSGRDLAAMAARWAERDHWRLTGEMHYRGLPQRWLVEEFLPAKRRKLEYKIFCFMGEPTFIGVILERDGPRIKKASMDCDWQRLDLRIRGSSNDPRPLPRPEGLDLMLAEARRLSADFMHVRVDFLEFDERLVFSELTFANKAAAAPYEPDEANFRLGALIDLDRAPEYLAHGRAVVDAMRAQSLACVS